MDPRNERDVEQLRRIAITQKVQIEHLLKVLAAQSRRIDELTGGDGELQQALDLLEQLNERGAGDANSDAGAGDAGAGHDETDGRDQRKKRKPRDKSGPTAQPKLATEPRIYFPSIGRSSPPQHGHV